MHAGLQALIAVCIVLLACAPRHLHQTLYMLGSLKRWGSRKTHRHQHLPSDMAPTITFVRHAQGYHNLNTANHSIHDPLLTPYGKQQCEHLSKTFPYGSDIDAIVASPIKRTIYTALLSFRDIISKRNLTLVALPEVQETSDMPCDTGSSKEEVDREFQGEAIDTSLLTPDWNSKKGRWGPTAKAIEERCQLARRWLRARPERHIIVVTHGGVLHYLTEDWADSDKFSGTGWANTEFRTYTFDPSATESASLIETAESRTRRRGTEKPLSEAEQRNLRRTAEAGWQSAGFTKKADVKSKV